VVVWATLDKSMGRVAIKSFVVPKDLPGIRVDRVEHKLGIRSSGTATIILDNCRVPKENLLGNPDIDAGFAGAMQTFDNTRPLVAAMAVGCARAALELTREMLTAAGVSIDYDRPAQLQVAAAATFLAMEADWEAAYLMTLQAAWLADHSRPNSVQASMAKAKAGRVGKRDHPEVRRADRNLGLRRERDVGEVGTRRQVLDIFEGTQQIQQLIIVHRVLRLSSSELK